MHPKNPLEKIDYSELAVAFPPLLKHLKNGRIKDFKDPKAIRDLNIAILLKYYKVRIEIPLDKLIPIIPSRLDYILHIADLFMEKRDLKGLDIGTGASCIYPILGATIFNWHFLALDIDQDSLEYAQENVSRNNLDSLIKVELNTSKKIIPKGSFDFLMCNPPFYRDHSHIHESKKLKLDNPTGECTGSNNEMITEGGEYEFVKRMIKESKRRDIKIADKHAPVNVFKRHTSVQDVEATMAQMDKQNKTSFTKWVKSENNLNYICTFKAELIKDFIEKDFESSIHALEWMTDGWSLESVSELILKLFYTKRISSAIFCRIVWGLAHSWELEKINDLLPVILVGESLSIIAAFVGNWVNISTMGSDNIAELVVGLACAFRWDIDQLEEFLLSLCAFICSDSVLQRSLCLIVHEELEYAYKAAIADPSKKILYTFEMLVQILIEESTK